MCGHLHDDAAHATRGEGRRELSDSTAEVLLLLNNLGDPRRIIIVGGKGRRIVEIRQVENAGLPVRVSRFVAVVVVVALVVCSRVIPRMKFHDISAILRLR